MSQGLSEVKAAVLREWSNVAVVVAVIRGWINPKVVNVEAGRVGIEMSSRKWGG
jgi:hypothetical protein